MKIKFGKINQDQAILVSQFPNATDGIELSEQIIQYLKYHQKFNEAVEKIKKEFGIPKDGFDILSQDDYAHAEKINTQEVQAEISKIIDMMHWQTSWRPTVERLVFFNEFFLTSDYPIDLMMGKMKSNNTRNIDGIERIIDISGTDRNERIVLAIRRKMSQREFISHIKQIWPMISEKMNKLPSKAKLPKTQETEYLNDALYLHEIEGMSYKEIVKKLKNKYPAFEISYNFLGKKIRAWKRRLKDT